MSRTRDSPDPTDHFTTRVHDYVRSRPGHPVEILDALREDVGLAPGVDVHWVS